MKRKPRVPGPSTSLASRTAGLEPRTFRYRRIWLHVGLCRVSAGALLLPLVGAAVAVAFAFNGMDRGWQVVGVTATIAVPLAALAWVLWRMGDRIANGRVVVDDTGVDVKLAYTNAKLAWEEITALTREQREWGYRRTELVWFLCLHSGERVIQIDPWVQSPDELAALIGQTTGLKVVDVPLA